MCLCEVVACGMRLTRGIKGLLMQTSSSGHLPRSFLIGVIFALAAALLATLSTWHREHLHNRPPYTRGEVLTRVYVVCDHDSPLARHTTFMGKCEGPCLRGRTAYVFRDRAEALAFAAKLQSLNMGPPND